MKQWIKLGNKVEDWYTKLPHEAKVQILGEDVPPSSASYFFKKKPVEFQVRKYLENNK